MNAPPKFPRSITITSREFNQHTSRAKAAADQGPVIITDRGKPAYVLLRSDQYERLVQPVRSVLDSLADTRPEADFSYAFERASGKARAVDLGLDD